MFFSPIVLWSIVAINTAALLQEPAGQPAGSAAPAVQESPTPVPARSSSKTDYPLNSLTEFSAVVTGAMFGPDSFEAHIYRSGNLFRNEMSDESYMITDLATRDSWRVGPLMCIHHEAPSFRAAPFVIPPSTAKIERVAVGQETLDGHPCHVEDITLTIEGEANPRRMRFWEADDLKGFPIQVQWQHIKGKMIASFKNVSLEKQDPSLFMRPAKCEQSVGGPMIGKPKAPAKKTPKPKQ
jgi:hypothetical protein